MSHTPGPWWWDLQRRALVAKGDGTDEWAPAIEIILDPSNALPEPENWRELIGACGHHAEIFAQDNAYLIAVAPNLLKVAKAIWQRVEEAVNVEGFIKEGHGRLGVYLSPDELVSLRAALAQAEPPDEN